jgi:hypothetical protein
MAEWSKAHAWKVCKLQKGFMGSNPILSAFTRHSPNGNGEHRSPKPAGRRRASFAKARRATASIVHHSPKGDDELHV